MRSLHLFRRLLAGYAFAMAGGLMLSPQPVNAATLDLTLNGVDWGSHYYAPGTGGQPQYDGAPNDGSGITSPQWLLPNSAYASATLNASYLTIDTQTLGNTAALRYYRSGPDSGWDAAISTTFEFTLRAVSVAPGATYAGGLYFGNSRANATILLSPTAIALGGQVYTGDFSDWTTFRVVLENMDSAAPSASLYINNSTDVALKISGFGGGKFNGASAAFLQFGDFTSADGSVNGITDWSGIRWTSEAVAPVPEPRTTAAFALGAILLLLATRNRNASKGSAL